MVADLVSASSEMIFGQLLHEDAEESRKMLKRLVSNTVTVAQASLLDKGAVPNLISWDFCEKLVFAPMDTDLQVTVADRTVAEVIERVQKDPISFGTLLVTLGLLVLRSAPFDIIIESPALEYMQAILYYERQQVTLAVRRKKVLLPLLSEPPVIDGMRTCSEEFTSLGSLMASSFLFRPHQSRASRMVGRTPSMN